MAGHWEGDLSLGAHGASAIGTLVERTTRLVVLVRMPTRKADVAASAFTGALNAIPAPLRKTLTYDQGKEMANHLSMAQATGMRIFFADPHSPWQRGSNENINGLLRQYFPKGTSLAAWDQEDLDRVAASLNDRPRKTLGYATPNEQIVNLLAALAHENESSAGGVRYQTGIHPRIKIAEFLDATETYLTDTSAMRDNAMQQDSQSPRPIPALPCQSVDHSSATSPIRNDIKLPNSSTACDVEFTLAYPADSALTVETKGGRDGRVAGAAHGYVIKWEDCIGFSPL